MKNAFTIALLGCPNCGKTTLFNLLTRESRRTGNWPGVTVEYCESIVRRDFLPKSDPAQVIRLVDLPGVFSLSPFSPEEAAALRYLKQSPPDALIVVIDSCAPAQGLYLLLSALQLHQKVIAAFSMTDQLRAQKGAIDFQGFAAHLHLPALGFSARSGENIRLLLETALLSIRQPSERSFTSTRDAAALHRTVDQLLSKYFSLPWQKKPAQLRPFDRLLLCPAAAVAALPFLLCFVFWPAFGPPGQRLSRLLSDWLQTLLRGISALPPFDSPLLRAFLTDGLLGSVAAVLSFLPVLLLFFFSAALLEDSGIMARAALLLDAPLARLGLSGRSFFPFVTGFGCSVPALLSARMLKSKRERELCMLLIPCIPCSAKYPLYLLFAAALPYRFLPSALLMLHAIFFLSLSFLWRKMLGRSESPLIMELPVIRRPALRGAVLNARVKTAEYILRAFTVIFPSTLAVWFLQYFTPALQPAAAFDESLLYCLIHFLTPLFRPLGFSSPLTIAALATGLMAKENIPAVLLLSRQPLFDSPAAALSFLVFCLLYAPCLATVWTLAREIKSRARTLLFVFIQTFAAWLAAFIVYHLSLILL